MTSWWTTHSDGRLVTLSPVEWWVGRDDSGTLITVPAGFVFDVSIPLGLTWLFDPFDRRYFRASCLHDWLLIDGWNRITAGAVFHEALTAEDISLFRRLCMWLAVSLFKYRQQEARK